MITDFSERWTKSTESTRVPKGRRDLHKDPCMLGPETQVRSQLIRDKQGSVTSADCSGFESQTKDNVEGYRHELIEDKDRFRCGVFEW